MKKLLFLILLLPLLAFQAQAQIVNNGPGTFVWTDSAPTHNPGASGAKFAVNKNTFQWYEWLSGTAWIESGDRIQTISGCAAPAYTPAKHNSTIVINSCDEPELYAWNGTAWKILIGGATIAYIQSAKEPTSKTVKWIDETTDTCAVQRVKAYIENKWETVAWFDTVGKVFSNFPPLYVLSSGQSNATSRDGGGDNSTNNAVTVFDYFTGEWVIASPGNAVFKPQPNCFPCNNYVTNFGKAGAADGRIVKIVSYSYGNQAIGQWADPPPSPMGDSLIAIINQSGVPFFDAFLWAQGESNDATPPNAYHVDFYNIITKLVATGKIDKKNTNTLIAEIAGVNNKMNISFNYMSNDTFANIRTVPTRDLTLIDTDHLSGSSLEKLGKRFYYAYRDGTKTATGLWIIDDSYNIYNTQKRSVGVGGKPTSGVRLDIYGRELQLGCDISTGNAAVSTRLQNDIKVAAISMPEFTGSTRFGMLNASSTDATNNVLFGGGIGGYSPATNVAFYTGAKNTTGGTSQADIDQVGYFYIRSKLGIGTYTGGERFTVAGNAELRGASPYLYFNSSSTGYSFLQGGIGVSGSGAGNYTSFVNQSNVGFSVSTGGVLSIVSAPTTGRVGFGTASPSEMVDVVGNVKASGHLIVGSWTTSTRPTPTGGTFPIGFNATTGNHEGWDGEAWNAFYEVRDIIKSSATLDFPSTSAHSNSDLTITVTGAAVGDGVTVAPGLAAISAHSCYTAWVSAANTVTVRFNHYGSDGGATDPASASFNVIVTKF